MANPNHDDKGRFAEGGSSGMKRSMESARKEIALSVSGSGPLVPANYVKARRSPEVKVPVNLIDAVVPTKAPTRQANAAGGSTFVGASTERKPTLWERKAARAQEAADNRVSVKQSDRLPTSGTDSHHEVHLGGVKVGRIYRLSSDADAHGGGGSKLSSGGRVMIWQARDKNEQRVFIGAARNKKHAAEMLVAHHKDKYP